MKAKIENGRIIVPPEVLRAAALPENGECEVVPQPSGIGVAPAQPPDSGPPYPTPWDLIEMLRRKDKPISAIDHEPDPADEVD